MIIELANRKVKGDAVDELGKIYIFFVFSVHAPFFVILCCYFQLNPVYRDLFPVKTLLTSSPSIHLGMTHQ